MNIDICKFREKSSDGMFIYGFSEELTRDPLALTWKKVIADKVVTGNVKLSSDSTLPGIDMVEILEGIERIGFHMVKSHRPALHLE